MPAFSSPTVWLGAASVAALNLPFGFWRAGVRRFSARWFAAVHVPVPLAIGLRIAMHIPFRMVTLPLFVAAFFAGQTIGARLRRPGR